VAVTVRRPGCEIRTQHGDQLAISVSAGKASGLDPVGDVFGSGAHQHFADLVDQRNDVLVQVDELVQSPCRSRGIS